MLRAVRGRRPVHIVQIGANAGGDEENEWVHQVLRRYQTWTATVVEPVPFLFEQLQAHYKEEMAAGRVEPLRYAITTYSGPCEMLVATSTSDVNVQQVSTLAFNPAAADGTRCGHKGRPCNFHQQLLSGRKMRPMQVPCLTLEALLLRRRIAAPVDILVIDAEMLDYTLLRSIRLREIAPLAIEFESKTMTLQQGAELSALLALQGYLCRFAPDDTWEGWGTRHYDSQNARYWRTLRHAESVCYRMT